MAWQSLKVVDRIFTVCYDYANKISPYKPQEIVSSMYYCRSKALPEKHLRYEMFFRIYNKKFLDVRDSRKYNTIEK